MTAGPNRGTSTRRFGTGRRENHDASDFYARFRQPDLSQDDDVFGDFQLDDPLIGNDSRNMAASRDNSVALVVTSPPYFAGKEYEEALGQGHVPASYLEYLQMLREVFSECCRVLEPGGRIAVNVANLGRKPYRSLSADVVRILQDDLGLLLRGEVIWAKAEGAAGSCAWGSFRSAANPVLRDVTERVVIASKGRFERALSPEQRRTQKLPWKNTLTNDEFMEATLDLWRIPPESARRVKHPAPFPVELPLRLIELYTYANDLVLDPFLGSGTTAVAAVRRGRRYAGYDTDPAYIEIAKARVADELERRATLDRPAPEEPPFKVPLPSATHEHFQARATEEGKAAQAIA
ncbi:MAG: DNA-methyltransferase, partial [Actinomycetota bacterium]